MDRKQNKTVVNLDDKINDEFAKYLKSKRDNNSSERLKEALEEQRRAQLC